MSASKLALLQWEMGQVLWPEQFEAQQEAILAHIGAMAALSGLPSEGLARLTINERQLAIGALQIERLTYVFASGLLIDFPGNAVVGNLNLDPKPAGPVSVYLHVGNEVGDATDLKHYPDEPRRIKRAIHRVELSLKASSDNARESVELMRLTHRDELWTLGDFAPPLLCIGPRASPFLRDTLRAILQGVREVQAQLARRIRDAFLGSDQGAELRRVRSAAHRVLAVLDDHGIDDAVPQQRVALHPYFLYSALREFYMQAATLDDEREVEVLRYVHGDIGPCFERLRQRIESSLAARSLSTQRLEFECRESLYLAGPFADGLRRATDIYLILKPGPGGPLNFEGVKVASPRRIHEVYTRALAGVPLSAFKSSPFAHVYGQDAVIYKVGADDDEWRLAVRDSEVCFPAGRVPAGTSAALMWGI
jgi:predicted component of type VI protein secretion system